MPDHKASRFSVVLPVSGAGDDLIAVFNTLTEAFVTLPQTQLKGLISGSTVEDREILEVLSAQGILVNRGVDESDLFQQWKDRHVHDFSTLRSKMLVTRRCNNACTYCIIGHEPGVMSAETARVVDEFYIHRIEDLRPQQVRDDYLGGEPLLNVDIITESAARRFFFCRGRGIDWHFSITTNGTLLTPAIVRRLRAVGLCTIRVSMAGPAEIHDPLRPLKKGGGTYALIMDNLEQIPEDVNLLLECQYDAGTDNYQRFPELFQDIARRGIRLTEINFTPILEKRGTDSFCCGMGDVSKYQYLKHQARQHGIPVVSAPPTNACMTDFRANFVFDTDGSLIPCPALQAGEMAYGTAKDGIDFTREAPLRRRRLPERCINNCELLPICMGGCRLQALTHNNDFNGMDCQYDTYRPLLEEYIRETAATALDAKGDKEAA